MTIYFHDFIAAWARWVVRRRVAVLVLTTIFLVAFLIQLPQLRYEHSPEMWFIENDPILTDLEQLKELFGDRQYLIIGLTPKLATEDLIQPRYFHIIDQITQFLQTDEAVAHVDSLSNYQYLQVSGSEMELIPLIPKVSQWTGIAPSQEGVRRILNGELVAHGRLFTPDLRHSAIYARLHPEHANIEQQVRLVSALRQLLDELNLQTQGLQSHLSGLVLINERILTSSEENANFTRGLMMVFILVLLFLFFQTWIGVVMPMVVVVGSLVTVMGTLAWVGWDLNLLNVTLPALVVAVGVGDAVHILTEFYRLRHAGHSPPEAASGSVKVLFLPCLYTSITTAVGFLTLTVTRLAPVTEYGIVAAIGVMVAFLLSVVTLPALLSFTHGHPTHTTRLANTGWAARLTQAMTPLTFRYKFLIVLIGGVVILISCGLLTQIQVDSSHKRFFRDNALVHEDLAYFEKVYGSSDTLEILINAESQFRLMDLDFLHQVLAFQQYLESLPSVSKATSEVDKLRQVHLANNDHNPDHFRLPERYEDLDRYLQKTRELIANTDGRRQLDVVDNYLLITVQYSYSTSSQARNLIAKIQQDVKTKFPMLNTTITGDGVMHTNRDVYILEGLGKSFLLAIGVIVICLFTLLRSLRYGTFSLVPSLVPIVFAGGVMGAGGIYLDFSTMIIAALTFGIVVDATIHVMTRYGKARRSGLDRKTSVHLALTQSGHAIFLTSIILFCGFIVNALSTFVPTMYFGLLGSIIILISLISVLVLLPALIFTLAVWKPES